VFPKIIILIPKVIILSIKSTNFAFDMNIGTKIKTLRESKVLSQSDLSAKLDISQGALCKIESGLVEKIDFALIHKLCDIFDVDFQYFFDEPIVQTNRENTNSAISIFGNPTVYNNIPEPIIETIMHNQQQINSLLETQNKLIDQLLKNHSG
jgi:transcriptional regulator with XRE-family HTH domain